MAYFISPFQDLQNSIPWRFRSLLHYVLVLKIQVDMPKITLSSLLTYISFFYKTFANFRYITYFVSSLIPVWFQSHGLYSICSEYPFKHSQSTHKFSRIMHFRSHNIVAMNQILDAMCHNCQKNVTKLTSSDWELNLKSYPWFHGLLGNKRNVLSIR